MDFSSVFKGFRIIDYDKYEKNETIMNKNKVSTV